MNEKRRGLVYEVIRRRKRGESRRGMARALHIDVKTVRKLEKEAEERRKAGETTLEREGISQRTPKGSKLDPYVPQIRAWLEEFPKLSVRRKTK